MRRAARVQDPTKWGRAETGIRRAIESSVVKASVCSVKIRGHVRKARRAARVQDPGD